MNNMNMLWKSLLAEFIGTFILVFVGGGAVALTIGQGGSIVASAFAFGLALMLMIYIFGSYSGAHLNPAVSLGFALSGRMHWGLMIGYWIVQILGGIAAGALIAYLYGTETGAGASVGVFTNTDAWRAVLTEAFITFFLVIAYLFVTGNAMLAIVSGFAIGLTLAFDTLVAFYLTGASTNPARSLGPAIFSDNLGTYWIYIVGPLIGAIVAAIVYKLYTCEWNCKTKVDCCGKPIVDECGRKIKECTRPLVDKCGNPIKDCNGTVMETYTKCETKMNHLQQTIPTEIARIAEANCISPRYVQQEVDHLARSAVDAVKQVTTATPNPAPKVTIPMPRIPM